MATMFDIVTSALRKIGVVAADEPPTADQLANGLDALNNMMHGWKLRGVDILHTDLAAGATFPLADAFREGTIYLLASRLGPDYEVPPMFDADDWFRGIQAAYLVIEPSAMPTGLLGMPSEYGRGKLSRGSE